MMMVMMMMMMMMVVVVVVVVEDELGISGDRGGEVPDDQRRGWEAVPVVRVEDRGTDGRRSDDTADARHHTHERQLLSAGMNSCLSVRLSVCLSVTNWYYDSKTSGGGSKTSAGTDGRRPDDTVDERHHTHDCLLLLLSISVLVLFSFPLFSCRFRAVN